MKKLWIANETSDLILYSELKDLVLTLRWAFSLKNSNECFFGRNGNFSGSLSPKTLILFAINSTLCPWPWLFTISPSTSKQAPVLIFDNFDSSSFS